jgi:aminoglycoside 6-adenylyltransferase
VALPTEAEVVRRLVAWAERDDAIRALVLTSSRARADGSVDPLSDYDVVIAVRDPRAFAEDDAWKSAYGRLLVGWGDENRVHGETTYFRGVVYDDGAKIDYTLWPDVLLERVADSAPLPADLDVGYRVLLDKDGQTTRWSAPTLRAHIPPKPTHGEYVALVEEFWWDTTYVAKSLWRGEAFFAKFALDFDAKFVALRKMLEWRIELDHGWLLRPGSHGRGLERLLPPDLWAELAATYVGTGIDENWDALFRTTALFRRAAFEVGQGLGYLYPADVDEAVTAQLERVRALPPRDAVS